MKKLIFSLSFLLCYSSILAQLDDTGSTSNGAMTIGNGTGTLYQFAGDQRGTDGTNQSQGGFGLLSGANQISPIIWMYGNGEKNAFQVIRKGYNATVQEGSVLFHVGANGRIGIDSNNPDEKFHVNGTTTITGDIGVIDDAIWKTGQHTLELQNSDAGDVVLAFHRAGYSSASIKHSTIGGLTISGNGAFDSDHLFVKTDGNVGIGTNNPIDKLHIFSSSSGGTSHSFSDMLIEDNDRGMFQILTSNVGVGYFGFADNDDQYVGGIHYEHANDRMVFRVNDHASDMVIDNQGSVGIGTTTTGTHKLAVEGTIGAREIKVEAGTWSDFVFHKDYTLPTLKEVEIHIKENGHLKDIPSEAEVKENGIHLGEMDAKLLQKIEELTLYTIAQDKTLKAQQEFMEAQQKLIETQAGQNAKQQQLIEKLVKRIETIENQ